METNIKSDETPFKAVSFKFRKIESFKRRYNFRNASAFSRKVFVWYLTAFGRRDVPYIERTPLALKNIVSFQSNKVS
jgi:hypothetical protein